MHVGVAGEIENMSLMQEISAIWVIGAEEASIREEVRN